MRRAAVVLVSLLLALGPGPAAAAPLPLPPPLADDAQSTALCGAVGSRPDRCLTSFVPGPVRNDEVVRVGVDGSGRPVLVEVEQRLRLSGTGDYAIRERGPARQARSLGELDPPVTKLGAVVWQGFSPGERDLAALLTLDPDLEAVRLPLSVTLAFTPVGGTPQPLGPSGELPGAGTVAVTVTNRTSQPAQLPTAADAAPVAVAALLDDLRERAALDRRLLDRAPGRDASPAPSPGSALTPLAPGDPTPLPLGQRLPAAGLGLPATVDVDGPARVQAEQSVPLNVSASLTVAGAGALPVAPASPLPGGAGLVGTLPGGQSVTLAATVDGPGTLELDLLAVPALDPRSLVPPAPATTWAQWAASGPDLAARRAALDLLVSSAAQGARASAYSPYLGADLPGSGSTLFRVALAPPDALPDVVARLTPRPGAIAATGVAVALLLLHGCLLWRRS